MRLSLPDHPFVVRHRDGATHCRCSNIRLAISSLVLANADNILYEKTGEITPWEEAHRLWAKMTT